MNPHGFGLTPLKLALVGKMMLRCLKMPLRCQLEPNMTPTWPSLGPPEGQSDLYFTCVFELFMFRFFIVLRGVMSRHGSQHGLNMGPKRVPKSAHEGRRYDDWSWDLNRLYWEGFFIPSPPSPPAFSVPWGFSGESPLSRSNRPKTASRRLQDEMKTT